MELPTYSYMLVSVKSSVVSHLLAFQSKQQQIIHIMQFTTEYYMHSIKKYNVSSRS